MKKMMILWLSLYCIACANTQEKTQEKNVEDNNNLDSAITAPLQDLNLVRNKIPDVLREAAKNPYVIANVEMTCEQIDQDIQALNTVLAPDVDAPKAKKESRMERGSEAIGKASLSAIKRTAESVVPYRSWVRKLTGAERESKIVARAIKAGNLRRAFLKGFKAKNCSVL